MIKALYFNKLGKQVTFRTWEASNEEHNRFKRRTRGLHSLAEYKDVEILN